MKSMFFHNGRRPGSLMRCLVAALSLVMTFITVIPALAAPGDTVETLAQPFELPVEIEVELGPASLKQAPLWKELIQLLREPDLAPIEGTAFGPSAVERRPGFGATMPPLNVWPLNYNFLTSQPLRLRTSDGGISWDQPGPLFHPDGTAGGPVAVDANNVPTELLEVVGHMVACPDNGAYQAAVIPVDFCTGKPEGSLVIYNPSESSDIPPNGTVVAVAAVVDGVLQELAGVSTTETEDIDDLEIPINEEDFYRDPADTQGIPAPLQAYIGRPAAEVMGKALFWDMQVGSDAVQSCGTCHFNAGADSRTRNQLNPNHLGGDNTLQVRGPNEDVVPADFPFHKLADPNLPGEPLLNPANVVSDANDVMSSMGVRFRQFVDIPIPGPLAFGPPVNGVRSLRPDIGIPAPDPIPVFQGLRRVEPRNTPTMHSAAFNFDNFWDGRARFAFNGGSVFGQSDPTAHIFINPNLAVGGNGPLVGATNGDIRPELVNENPDMADQPVRIKFSSLASQAVGPPLSEFEMSFLGRSWAKIGKKLLQGEPNSQTFGNGAPQELGTNRANAVVPLANQLVATDDSRLGPFSNQGGSVCQDLGRPTAVGKPGLCIAYGDLTRLTFARQFWNRNNRHLNGAPDPNDPFDGYSLAVANGAANAADRNQFRQIEANFSLFFALAAQAYEELLIPDDTPFDRFMDANPLAANGVGQPGEQRVLFPTLIPGLVGTLTMIPDDPTTAEYDGFGPEELYGFDVFAAGNLTAALPVGTSRNPDGFGSNPFTRHARCSLCHAGPEQTDHSINFAHGLIKGDAEFEFPSPPLTGDTFIGADGTVIEIPTPEPPGPIATVPGLVLAEEVEETAQDVVELEPRNMAMTDDPATPYDDAIIAAQSDFAFGDQGIYNVAVRPIADDLGRGDVDPFGWPLSMSALAMKNVGGQDYEPFDDPLHPGTGPMIAFDPALGPGGGLYEETGGGFFFPDSTYTLQSINPGLEKTPMEPQLPAYMAPWISDLPAGELHPQIDELGFIVNTVTFPNGGPALEFAENLSATDLHCGLYDPTLFGFGPPNFGWGATDPVTGDPVNGVCANNQSGVPGNMGLENTAGTNDAPLHGTWDADPLFENGPNRVGRRGAFKAPQLRNVELTGPYFHTGSYLTLRQVVDFYMRGGDFPVTNAEGRDQHIVDIEMQAFGFGTTRAEANGGPIPDVPFADALPDTDFQFDPMPDTDHNLTPEFATQEDAKVALVKFLLSLTDQRVRYERAPFDRPELFVPVDGTAPDNLAGRLALQVDPRFRHLPAVGAGGNPNPVPAFLGISRTPIPGPNNDHFDQ